MTTIKRLLPIYGTDDLGKISVSFNLRMFIRGRLGVGRRTSFKNLKTLSNKNDNNFYSYALEEYNTNALAKNLELKNTRRTKNSQARQRQRLAKKARETNFVFFNRLVLHKIPTTINYSKSKFHISENTYSYNVDNTRIFGDMNPADWVKFIRYGVFKLYQTLISNTRSGVYFRILLESKNNKSVSSHLQSFGEFTIGRFKKEFLSRYNTEDLFTGKFTVQLRSIPTGGAMLENIQIFLKKKGISIIYNDDNLCGQRCLVLAELKTNDALRNMKTAKSVDKWNNSSAKMCKKISVFGRMSFCDFEIWADLEKKQVVILSEMFIEAYKTATNYEDKIYLYYDTSIQHYHFIHDINSATNDLSGNHKWCKHCNKSFRRDTEAFKNHKCISTVCGLCKNDFKSVFFINKRFITMLTPFTITT